MKLSLCVQTPEVEPVIPVALLSGTFTEKLAKAAAWGADGIELMTTEPTWLDWQEIEQGLRANGLQASAIASGGIAFALGLTLLHPQSEIASKARQRLSELIDLAQALQAPVVTIGSFRGRAAPVGDDARLRLKDILAEASSYAQARGVHLALEAVNRYETDIVLNAEQGLEFIAEVNQPALGLLLDTYHVNIEEASWTVPFQRVMAAGKLYHVHLGENNRLAPGWGLIDFPAIVSTLRQAGYSGYLSAELLAKPDADSAARQTLEHMRHILARH